ncbi:hypothetical protein C8F04DRAFT_955209 [Mycena alexandri]|uniref:Uncharacterized protein n=1 Tax=Mycena alexandri TaxID=1745969 RepID=A0AAD6T0X3_9AGAR|nr:hypothetical protein C8F04DRAFT_955209 [Mycena alexandri]
MPETPIKKAKGTSRARKVPKFSPRTAASVAFSLRSHLHLNARDSAEDESGSESDAPKRRKRKPRALNKINHSKSGWRRVGSSHTAEIFKTFEGWYNDYTPHGYETAENLVEVKHLGHPVDRPRDIRARPFIVQWITPDRDVPQQFSNDPRPVFRVEYRCSGSCGDVPPSDDSQNLSDSDHAPVKEHKDLRAKNGKKKYQKRTCPQAVVIHVEVYSNDLSKAVIYQRGTHWETAEEYLRFSEYIRQCIMEYASLANMTAGRIKRSKKNPAVSGQN